MKKGILLLVVIASLFVVGCEKERIETDTEYWLRRTETVYHNPKDSIEYYPREIPPVRDTTRGRN
jgi:hypothetical protein